MNKHKGDKKGFSWHSQQWYGSRVELGLNVVDSLTIGFYADAGGTSGEFSINWERLGSNIVPLLECYDDGWSALFNMPELIKYMGTIDDKNISIGEFAGQLVELGFIDRTVRTNRGFGC